MHASNRFDALYSELAQAWEAYESMRRSHSSHLDLAESSFRLYRARMAMWDWHHNERMEID